MKLSFKGKTAVITGASGGMGIECVKKLNKTGLKILMLDIKNPPAFFLKKYKKIEFIKVDITDFNKLKNLEMKTGFVENYNKKEPFFNKGKPNQWQNILDENVAYKLEKKFKKEMQELKYI